MPTGHDRGKLFFPNFFHVKSTLPVFSRTFRITFIDGVKEMPICPNFAKIQRARIFAEQPLQAPTMPSYSHPLLAFSARTRFSRPLLAPATRTRTPYSHPLLAPTNRTRYSHPQLAPPLAPPTRTPYLHPLFAPPTRTPLLSSYSQFNLHFADAASSLPWSGSGLRAVTLNAGTFFPI